ncbi:MAG: polymerase sigma-70 factor [Marmoricola sp.]|nr:polymerase sigma-70 factor [Marmoricola sp.]
MGITLASEKLSDAEVTDGIGAGDVGSAARLWVRYWPTALGAARQFVDPAEVPGLAAEALIGTIASIGVGRGPRDSVESFVRDAVQELGDEGTPPAPAATPHPDVFVSPTMTRAFSGLTALAQEVLWFTVVGEETDELIAEALNISVENAAEVRQESLTTLQDDYLAVHVERAESNACRQTHAALATAVEDRTAPLPGEDWVHMSACAVCTEAFHELAFSAIAISSLVDRSTLASVIESPAINTASASAANDVYEGLFAEPAVQEAVVPVGRDDEVATPAFDPGAETMLTAAVVEPEPEKKSTARAGALVLPSATTTGTGSHAAVVTGGFLGRRRGRLLAGAAAAVAAVAVIGGVAVGMNGQGGARPTAGSEGDQNTNSLPVASESSEPTPTSEPTVTDSPAPTPSDDPTPSDAPTTTEDDVLAPAMPDPTPATSPSAKPTTSATPKPSSTPRPTKAPTTSAPKPSATPKPTPKPSPTPTCNGLQHLFGFC